MDNNKNILYQAIGLAMVIVVVLAINFLVVRYYVRDIVSQELESRNMATNQTITDQVENRDTKDAENLEEGLKNKITNFSEISGTVVEVKNDHIKIRPSDELLDGVSDQVFISDYLRDRTVKITGDTRILKSEITDKGDVTVARKNVVDIKDGDYVTIISKENIGIAAEFTAASIQLPL